MSSSISFPVSDQVGGVGGGGLPGVGVGDIGGAGYSCRRRRPGERKAQPLPPAPDASHLAYVVHHATKKKHSTCHLGHYEGPPVHCQAEHQQLPMFSQTYSRSAIVDRRPKSWLGVRARRRRSYAAPRAPPYKLSKIRPCGGSSARNRLSSLRSLADGSHGPENDRDTGSGRRARHHTPRERRRR